MIWKILVVFLLLTCPAKAITGERLVLLSGHVARWTPINLGPIVLAWWDAQDTADIPLSGSNVITWTDRIGRAVATPSASPPTWSAAARNGKPGITCNGTNQFLSAPIGSFPVGAASSSLVSAAFNGTSANTGIFGYGSNATKAWRDITTMTGPVVGGSMFSGDITTAIPWSNVDHFVIYNVANGAQQVFVDGASGGTSANVPATSSSPVFFCSFPQGAGGVGPFGGVIQQALILNAIPNTCQQQKLEGWESWYDGKSGSNLPSNHPYKNGPPTVGGAC